MRTRNWNENCRSNKFLAPLSLFFSEGGVDKTLMWQHQHKWNFFQIHFHWKWRGWWWLACMCESRWKLLRIYIIWFYFLLGLLQAIFDLYVRLFISLILHHLTWLYVEKLLSFFRRDFWGCRDLSHVLMRRGKGWKLFKINFIKTFPFHAHFHLIFSEIVFISNFTS